MTICGMAEDEDMQDRRAEDGKRVMQVDRLQTVPLSEVACNLRWKRGHGLKAHAPKSRSALKL